MLLLKHKKNFFILASSILFLFGVNNVFASTQEKVAVPTHSSHASEEIKKLDPGDLLLSHVMNSHEFHFFTLGKVNAIISLPIILYSPQRGWSFFMSSRLEDDAVYDGYRMISHDYLDQLIQQKVDIKKQGLRHGKIVAVDVNGAIDMQVKIYDLSITKNVVQMFLSVILLSWLMIGIAKRYKRGEGIKTAPHGAQNLLEPIIVFVRDEVGFACLGNNTDKYMPYLLSLFFFILINNLIGLVPSVANVTGNIAFTFVLGVIAFIVIIFSTKKYYWKHIFNPPNVPMAIKCILIPVEILGIFTKPFALIIRLFANMIAGHMIITCLVILIFIFGIMSQTAGYGFSPVSIAFVVFIYFIEILVAFIQAFIFTNLTAVFIGQVLEEHAHHVKHHTH